MFQRWKLFIFEIHCIESSRWENALSRYRPCVFDERYASSFAEILLFQFSGTSNYSPRFTAIEE
jgi:hypothetical protein